MTVNRNANGLARPAAIVAHVWTHIARVQLRHAGRIGLAEAENGGGGTGTRDRGPGPGLFQGRGRGRETEITMGGSQGLGQDRDLASVRGRVLTRGPARAPVPAPLLAHGLVQSLVHDQGRGTGEPVIGNAPAALAPGVGPGVVAGVAVGNESVEEREVVRRMCVFCLFIISSLHLIPVSEEREERTAEKWGSTDCCGQRVG